MPDLKPVEPEIDLDAIHYQYKEQIKLLTQYNEQYLKDIELLRIENEKLKVYEV